MKFFFFWFFTQGFSVAMETDLELALAHQAGVEDTEKEMVFLIGGLL